MQALPAENTAIIRPSGFNARRICTSCPTASFAQCRDSPCTIKSNLAGGKPMVSLSVKQVGVAFMTGFSAFAH